MSNLARENKIQLSVGTNASFIPQLKFCFGGLFPCILSKWKKNLSRLLYIRKII